MRAIKTDENGRLYYIRDTDSITVKDLKLFLKSIPDYRKDGTLATVWIEHTDKPHEGFTTECKHITTISNEDLFLSIRFD